MTQIAGFVTVLSAIFKIRQQNINRTTAVSHSGYYASLHNVLLKMFFLPNAFGVSKSLAFTSKVFLPALLVLQKVSSGRQHARFYNSRSVVQIKNRIT